MKVPYQTVLQTAPFRLSAWVDAISQCDSLRMYVWSAPEVSTAALTRRCFARRACHRERAFAHFRSFHDRCSKQSNVIQRFVPQNEHSQRTRVLTLSGTHECRVNAQRRRFQSLMT